MSPDAFNVAQSFLSLFVGGLGVAGLVYEIVGWFHFGRKRWLYIGLFSHVVIFYIVVVGLRLAGVTVGSHPWSIFISFWSSALRVHFLASILLYLIAVDRGALADENQIAVVKQLTHTMKSNGALEKLKPK